MILAQPPNLILYMYLCDLFAHIPCLRPSSYAGSFCAQHVVRFNILAGPDFPKACRSRSFAEELIQFRTVASAVPLNS